VTASLTDRYVWAVLREVPGDQRADLEPEIRTLVADTVDAKAADGRLDPAAAERAALEELGNPGLLAGRYSGGQRYLIGPAVFPEWRRLVTTLVAILVPIIAIVSFGASMLAREPIGQAIVAAGGGAFMVAVQTVFWVTVVFAAIERTGDVTSLTGKPWTPDALPDVPADGRLSVVETGASIVFQVVFIGAILWLQLAAPITIDGTSYPLFDPALWSSWLPAILGVLVLELGFQVALAVRGRYTWAFAVVNAVLGAAFAIPVIYLLLEGLLFNPALVTAVTAETGGDWLEPTSQLTALVIGVVTFWDAVDGFLKAWRASQPKLAATA
jgi:hypothetical protein